MEHARENRARRYADYRGEVSRYGEWYAPSLEPVRRGRVLIAPTCRLPPDERYAMQRAGAPLTMNVMPTPIAKDEAVSLLRKAEEETAPVELVGTGEGQQALYVLGFVDVENGGESFSIYVPGQIAVVFQLQDAEFEYGEPREAPPEHRARAQKLLQFALGLKKTEWTLMIRVWKRPDEVTVH